MNLTEHFTLVFRAKKRGAGKNSARQRKNKTVKTDDMLAILDFVLENDNFKFNGKNYTRTPERSASSTRLVGNQIKQLRKYW